MIDSEQIEGWMKKAANYYRIADKIRQAIEDNNENYLPVERLMFRLLGLVWYDNPAIRIVLVWDKYKATNLEWLDSPHVATLIKIKLAQLERDK